MIPVCGTFCPTTYVELTTIVLQKGVNQKFLRFPPNKMVNSTLVEQIK